MRMKLRALYTFKGSLVSFRPNFIAMPFLCHKRGTTTLYMNVAHFRMHSIVMQIASNSFLIPLRFDVCFYFWQRNYSILGKVRPVQLIMEWVASEMFRTHLCTGAHRMLQRQPIAEGNFPRTMYTLYTQDKLGRSLALAVDTFLAFQSKILSAYRRSRSVGLSDHFKTWPFSTMVRLEFGRPTDQASQSTSGSV